MSGLMSHSGAQTPTQATRLWRRPAAYLLPTASPVKWECPEQQPCFLPGEMKIQGRAV